MTDEICQKIINKIPEIKNIVDILSKSNDYISYINRINQNFSNIFKAIEQLKSLKGIFKVHFKVSQKDKIKELVKSHEELIKKQEKKGKYFISFISIIEDYYNLYIDNENLEDLSELLIMINLESEKFPKINKIKTLKNNILIKIRDLLLNKLNNINGKDIVNILVKIKSDFSNEDIFTFNYKKSILEYFIKKCKDNDKEIMNEYRNQKIYELFSNSNKEKNLLVSRLKVETFSEKDNFLILFPEKPNQIEINIISELLNKIIEKINDNDMDYDSEKYNWCNIFKKKDFVYYIELIKSKTKNIKIIIKMIIHYLTNNKNCEKNDLEKIVKYLDENYFQQNIFFFEINNKENCIPIYILSNIENENDKFKKKLINKLSDFVIDLDSIVEVNNKKFLLLKEIIKYKNNKNEYKYFIFNYEKKTKDFILK